jgi:hypothetical protein
MNMTPEVKERLQVCKGGCGCNTLHPSGYCSRCKPEEMKEDDK